ncbi:hypothetical protein N657DRAFT_560978 [Parathielavia appendiculata]|uniref:N-acetyltransferase domain-containing protein n=1 Tax=Parathielavia appendiculata TaxID=2587402 RepID=A0AAN6Z8Q7_9PEZI|nr:hypothetical protein N657DRAFT_560978 [Parathielavia appendiculata]
MTPDIILEDTPTPSEPLLRLLKSHLPHSLPVLRRLQFALNFSGGRTPHTHVLYAHYPGDDTNDTKGGHFAAGCVDLSRGPETQLWIYSSLEHAANNNNHSKPDAMLRDGYSPIIKADDAEEERALTLVLAILRRIKAVAAAASTSNSGSDDVHDGNEGGNRTGEGAPDILVGSLHETVRQGLLARGVRMSKAPAVGPEVDWEFCGKWLFRVEDFPVPPAEGRHEEGLPEGMRWDRVRKEDVGVVLARTSIKRKELDDGTPIAWAFMGDIMESLGLDGTLMTLHVEEEYRQRGLAKALACKLMREHLQDYGDDCWGAADVFVENHKSQALCRSIGGKNSWTLSW